MTRTACALTFAASFAPACATYRLVERPAISWAAGWPLPPRFVARQREADMHDAWFRAEVEQAMREADDPAVTRLPHEKIASRRQLQRAALQRRIVEP